MVPVVGLVIALGGPELPVKHLTGSVLTPGSFVAPGTALAPTFATATGPLTVLALIPATVMTLEIGDGLPLNGH